MLRSSSSNKGILAKMAAVQAEVERMEKDGTNQFQHYKYLSETQITFQMKTLFDKHGIVFLYSSRINSVTPQGKQLLTDVTVEYSFYDVTSGEFVGGEAAGQGTDTGDKGVYKAITGAIKYIYMKTFNIPTGDDPENDSKGSNQNLIKAKTAIRRLQASSPAAGSIDSDVDEELGF